MSNHHPAPLASLTLTHVYYDAADPVSYLCAWLALVPQALCVVYVTLVWSTREAEVCLAFAGQLVCEAVNFALKRLIKEERPPHHHRHGSPLSAWLGWAADDAAAAAGAEPSLSSLPPPPPIRGGYGMPSSHAQFAGYWALTIALFLLVRWQAAQPGASKRSSKPSVAHAHAQAHAQAHAHAFTRAQRVAASALAFVVAVLIAWSRVYLHYHTPRQVLAGFAAGLAVGAAWFAATARARRWGLVDWALRLPPAQWLRLRDLAPEEDVLQAGWERWQARQAARAAAKAR